MHGLLSGGTSVVFMWVPSHVELAGYLAADIAAKVAQLLPVSNFTVPYSDYNSQVRTRALKQWKLRWNSEILNKLHNIEPRVNVINLFRLPCWDEIIIYTLRIGHTYLSREDFLLGAWLVKSSWLLSISCCIVYLFMLMIIVFAVLLLPLFWIVF